MLNSSTCRVRSRARQAFPNWSARTASRGAGPVRREPRSRRGRRAASVVGPDHSAPGRGEGVRVNVYVALLAVMTLALVVRPLARRLPPAAAAVTLLVSSALAAALVWAGGLALLTFATVGRSAAAGSVGHWSALVVAAVDPVPVPAGVTGGLLLALAAGGLVLAAGRLGCGARDLWRLRSATAVSCLPSRSCSTATDNPAHPRPAGSKPGEVDTEGVITPALAPGSLPGVVMALHRIHRDLGTPLHAEFRQQVGHVVLHGLLRQEDPLGDLPVCQAFADQV